MLFVHYKHYALYGFMFMLMHNQHFLSVEEFVQYKIVMHFAAYAMGNLTPLQGVINDIKGRKKCYKQDWLDSCRSGLRYSFLI